MSNQIIPVAPFETEDVLCQLFCDLNVVICPLHKVTKHFVTFVTFCPAFSVPHFSVPHFGPSNLTSFVPHFPVLHFPGPHIQRPRVLLLSQLYLTTMYTVRQYHFDLSDQSALEIRLEIRLDLELQYCSIFLTENNENYHLILLEFHGR